MKRILRFSLLLLVAFTAMTVQAQGVKFGVKGGYNITDITIDKTQNASQNISLNKKNKNGWYVGPTLKVSLIGGLGVDIAALYDQRETEIGEDLTVKEQYVYVPLNLRYNLGLGSLIGIYLAAGPQVGFNVGDSEYDLHNLSASSQQAQDQFQLKKSTFGVNVGAGVYLTKHFEVGAVYNIPLGNTADIKSISDARQQYDVKNNTFQVSATIYF